MILSKHSSESGTTLIEAMVAACTSAMFLGSLFAMNMTGIKAIRTAREAACASQVLQQRVEAMRIANWHQVTDANWVKNNLLSTNAAGSDVLRNISETITLVPYGSSTTGNTQLLRTNGTASIVNQTALLKEGALKVIWTVSYRGGINSQPVSRQAVAILAQGGVAKW
jgi:Tfp pilus assembly protein PilV